jgi:AraC-like DNA-binding protein
MSAAAALRHWFLLTCEVRDHSHVAAMCRSLTEIWGFRSGPTLAFRDKVIIFRRNDKGAEIMPEFAADQLGVQRCGIFSELPEFLRSFGVDPKPLLEKHGFACGDLDDRDRALPFANVVRLLDDCARVTENSAFGFLLGLRARNEHLGLIGEMVRAAPTLGRAIRAHIENHHRVVRGGAPYVVEQDPYIVRQKDQTLIGYRCLISGLPSLQFLLASVGAGVAIVQELCGQLPKEILFACSETAVPAADEIRAAVKPARVVFESHHFGFTYPKHVVDLPLPSADPVKFERTMKQVQGYWNDLEPDFADQIRRLLLPALHAERAHMRMVCEATGLTPRTVNRRLAEQGTTLRTLVNETRYSIARQLLRHTHLPVAAVAQVMGYSEPGVFVRAFRQWSGSTPDSWRKSLPRMPAGQAQSATVV